ncbi:MAG TPA: PP2C family protein-serine/threonine phosphatase, partial [Blastocatellia bacterium]|nr:PP2C family protein-serine/threonine phosphatase [Blastocatellia bacterium]
QDGTSELLDDAGLPLGVFSDSRYSESVINFRPGDILILYTDGVTDARDGNEESFGLGRLERTVRDVADRRAHEICDAVTTAVRAHSADVGGLEDDLTLSIIKVNDPGNKASARDVAL